VENALAARTIDRATAALRKEAVACLPEIVKLMRTLSHKASEVSVPDLAEVIQKDAVILSKVIGAANTLGYNPAAVPVTTVTQAIHVVGYERIRSLAMSLLLVEQTNRSRNAEEQREVAALALTAGCIAQAAAESRTLLSPEEAFVCASLRNFGRIVMVTCMIDDYREALQLAGEHASDEAFLQIFGLTPLELGHQLLKAADLPEDILITLRALPPEAIANLDTSPGSQMLAITDFSARLAEVALTPDLDAAGFAAKSEELARRYGTALPGLADQALLLIESAAQQLDHFVHTLRIKSLPTRTLSRLKLRAAAIDPSGSIKAAEPSPVAPARSGSSSTPPLTVPAEPAPLPRIFSWETEFERISALASSPGTTRDALYAAALDSIQRGLAAPECVLFTAAANGIDYRVTHGLGSCFPALAAEARARADERNIFGVCLTRGENILIHHAADPKLAPYLPAWLPERRRLGAFVLLPLVRDNKTRGLVLAGWADTRQIVLPPDHVRLIRRLLSVVCETRDAVAA
jgi:HD-like signal output (HDOD) protein